MSYSSSSQVVLAMSYPTFGPCLKTSISVSLVIVVGADEEQLRGTGGGIEVTMTIWNACKHSSERTPCPKKEGCTKSSSHLATRLIKVSQNCSAKPSSLLLGPPRWTTLCSQFKVLAFFSELQNDAIGICQGLKRLSILYIKHHLAPGPVKIKWKKNIICMAPPDQFLYVYAQQDMLNFSILFKLAHHNRCLVQLVQFVFPTLLQELVEAYGTPASFAQPIYPAQLSTHLQTAALQARWRPDGPATRPLHAVDMTLIDWKDKL